ncbi:hypothetical protein NOVO_00330 [Rickettsiales bacterium Ac37b]|nr:hypothetical protein NOVO_00330 [Rickettsiales bacterium Ac37b]
MVNTSHLLIPLLMPNQSQKEVIINEAFIIIDVMLNRGVKSINVDTPPNSTQNGDIYIVGDKPTEEWVTKNKHIAYYQDGWRFIKPNEGMQFWVNDKDQIYIYNGERWISFADSIIQILKNQS